MELSWLIKQARDYISSQLVLSWRLNFLLGTMHFLFISKFMTRTIHCIKLNKQADGLDFPPYPGELGKKIYQGISKEAWQLWLGRQTMLINEYRLSMLDQKAREFLATEMERFLFSGDSAPPAGYTPEK
jgi:Fe-S cluster biosynthesis and repair protein YggX